MNSSQNYIQTNSILTLLQQAISGNTTQSHRQIYQHISQIQTQPATYMSLVHIISEPTQQISHEIKKMAMILLKTSLKRNADILEFSQQQFEYFRKSILDLPVENDKSMEKAKKILLSTIVTWNKTIDFMILQYLLSMINSDHKKWQIYGLEVIKMVFQDLKFQTENHQQLSSNQFAQFSHKFTSSFASKFQQADTTICALCLQCMNLIIHHIPNDSAIINAYISSYLLPLLSNPFNQSLQMRIQILQGLIQIIQLDSSYIFKTPNTLQLIIKQQIQYNQHIQQASSADKQKINQIKKSWLSLLLDLIIADAEDQRLNHFMEQIVRKIIICLSFTKEDQKQMNIQLQQEINPYSYQDNDDDDDEDQSGNFKTSWSYTPRKLAILCLSRIVVNYPQQSWNKLHPCLDIFLKSQDFFQKQIGVLLLGIIYENSEDNLQILEHCLPIPIEIVNNQNYPIFLRCTSLWTFSKISHLIVRDPVIQYQVEKQLVKCMNNNKDIRINNNAYMALDQIITASEDLPRLMNEIINCLAAGISNCTGKSLYSILKVCATLFQRHSTEITNQITLLIIQKLCQKWAKSITIQSIMCPLIQCLVTIVAGKGQCFINCGPQIFTQSAQIIQKYQHQKQLIIRVIDLLSALIALKHPLIVQWISQNGDFHSNIIYKKLLGSSQQQIINFTYGLIGDICKTTKMKVQYAQQYFKVCAHALQQKQNLSKKTSYIINNLTFCSNSLTCLADLVVAHPELALKNNCEYSRWVIQIAVKKLSMSNLSKIYAFNFSRILGRVGRIVPQCGAQYIGNILMAACIGLRANQYNALTDDAFEGLLKMIAINSNDSTKNFEFFVDSFICYPCGRQDLKQNFISMLKSFRNSCNTQQWHQFLCKPIFLPAIAKKIDHISCN